MHAYHHAYIAKTIYRISDLYLDWRPSSYKYISLRESHTIRKRMRAPLMHTHLGIGDPGWDKKSRMHKEIDGWKPSQACGIAIYKWIDCDRVVHARMPQINRHARRGKSAAINGYVRRPQEPALLVNMST